MALFSIEVGFSQKAEGLIKGLTLAIQDFLVAVREDHQELLTAVRNLETKVMATKDEVSAALDTYFQAVKDALAQRDAAVEKIIQEARDADNKLDAQEMDELLNKVKAATAEIQPPAPPPVPDIEPSNVST